MKKIIVLLTIAILTMALSAGCTCKRVDPDTKVTTDNFTNCLSNAQDLFCSPTDEEKAEAASVLSFITSGVEIASIYTTIPITVAEVQTIFALIQAGACVLTTDLELAVQWYNAVSETLQTKAMTGKMAVLKVMPPAIPALQAEAAK